MENTGKKETTAKAGGQKVIGQKPVAKKDAGTKAPKEAKENGHS